MLQHTATCVGEKFNTRNALAQEWRTGIELVTLCQTYLLIVPLESFNVFGQLVPLLRNPVVVHCQGISVTQQLGHRGRASGRWVGAPIVGQAAAAAAASASNSSSWAAASGGARGCCRTCAAPASNSKWQCAVRQSCAGPASVAFVTASHASAANMTAWQHAPER